MESQALNHLTLAGLEPVLLSLAVPISESDIARILQDKFSNGNFPCSAEQATEKGIDFLFEDLEIAELDKVPNLVPGVVDDGLNLVSYTELPMGTGVLVSYSEWTDCSIVSVLPSPTWESIESAIEFALQDLWEKAVLDQLGSADGFRLLDHIEYIEQLRSNWQALHGNSPSSRCF